MIFYILTRLVKIMKIKLSFYFFQTKEYPLGLHINDTDNKGYIIRKVNNKHTRKCCLSEYSLHFLLTKVRVEPRCL